MATKTVVFIHGNFVNYQSWDSWVERYEARGYKCVAIRYPLRDKTVPELRKAHPDPKLGKLAIQEVVDHHVRIIQALDEAPIIMGHSFGGLLTQIMTSRGLGVANVAIDSVPPQGVLTTKLSFFRSTFPLLNPLLPATRPYMMPFKHWQYTFTNGLPLQEQRKSYEAYTVPESKILARGGLSSAARIDFKKAHVPLLFIAGEKDNIMPAVLNKATYNRYKKGSSSITDFKEFPGRTHYTVIGGNGWEEVADYALEWAEKHQAAGAEKLIKMKSAVAS